MKSLLTEIKRSNALMLATSGSALRKKCNLKGLMPEYQLLRKRGHSETGLRAPMVTTARLLDNTLDVLTADYVAKRRKFQ